MEEGKVGGDIDAIEEKRQKGGSSVDDGDAENCKG